jgi:hypothetical protein
MRLCDLLDKKAAWKSMVYLIDEFLDDDNRRSLIFLPTSTLVYFFGDVPRLGPNGNIIKNIY